MAWITAVLLTSVNSKILKLEVGSYLKGQLIPWLQSEKRKVSYTHPHQTPTLIDTYADTGLGGGHLILWSTSKGTLRALDKWQHLAKCAQQSAKYDWSISQTDDASIPFKNSRMFLRWFSSFWSHFFLLWRPNNRSIITKFWVLNNQVNQ